MNDDSWAEIVNETNSILLRLGRKKHYLKPMNSSEASFFELF